MRQIDGRESRGSQAISSMPLEGVVGLILVLGLHGALIWGLWQHRLLPSARETETLFVNFIAPPAPAAREEPKRPPPKPRPLEKPEPRRIVARAPVVAPSDYVAPPPPPQPAPEPVIEAPPAPPPAGPVALSAELAVTCPTRSAPAYPAASRRLSEEGTVVLRVELDETGRIAATRVHSSSGHERLDAAALAVVRTWRCNPARRHGEAVRAVALQPFKFFLEGN